MPLDDPNPHICPAEDNGSAALNEFVPHILAISPDHDVGNAITIHIPDAGQRRAKLRIKLGSLLRTLNDPTPTGLGQVFFGWPKGCKC